MANDQQSHEHRHRCANEYLNYRAPIHINSTAFHLLATQVILPAVDIQKVAFVIIKSYLTNHFYNDILDIMTWLIKNWPAALLLAAGICACVATFFISKQDQEQRNLIQNLGEENVKLSKGIKELNDLNNKISSKTEEMAEINNDLSHRNYLLSEQNHNLISQVHLLVENSKELIAKINNRTAFSEEENAQTGELIFDFNPITDENKDFVLQMGSSYFSGKVKYFKSYPGNIVGPEGREILRYITAEIDSLNKILISTTVYDNEGHQIIKIVDNRWRPNRNFIPQLNYDSRGMEAIDNNSNIALSIDVVDNNKVVIQGIFADPLSDDVLTLFGKETVPFYKSTKEGMAKAHVNSKFQFDSALAEKIKEAHFHRLFEYTGKNWLHKRVMVTH